MNIDIQLNLNKNKNNFVWGVYQKNVWLENVERVVNPNFPRKHGNYNDQVPMPSVGIFYSVYLFFYTIVIDEPREKWNSI